MSLTVLDPAFAGSKRSGQDTAQLWKFEARSFALHQQLELFQAGVKKLLADGQHQDTSVVYDAFLKEAELEGRHLGALILDVQLLESMIQAQQWGGNRLTLGTPWSLQELSGALENYRIAAHSIAHSQGERALSLFSISAFKMRSGGDSALLWQAAAQARIMGNHSLADTFMRQAQTSDRVDTQPLTLSLLDREYPVTPEFMREVTLAFWSGLTHEVPHLMPNAPGPFDRVQALLRLSKQLKTAKAFGALDGSDVEQSCATALAYQKRN